MSQQKQENTTLHTIKTIAEIIRTIITSTAQTASFILVVDLWYAIKNSNTGDTSDSNTDRDVKITIFTLAAIANLLKNKFEKEINNLIDEKYPKTKERLKLLGETADKTVEMSVVLSLIGIKDPNLFYASLIFGASTPHISHYIEEKTMKENNQPIENRVSLQKTLSRLNSAFKAMGNSQFLIFIMDVIKQFVEEYDLRCVSTACNATASAQNCFKPATTSKRSDAASIMLPVGVFFGITSLLLNDQKKLAQSKTLITLCAMAMLLILRATNSVADEQGWNCVNQELGSSIAILSALTVSACAFDFCNKDHQKENLPEGAAEADNENQLNGVCTTLN